MAQITCLKTFNEHGLYITPGVVKVEGGLYDYLLSNYPAYFVPFVPVPEQEPTPDTIIEPEPEPEAKDIEEPPADKMMHKPKRRK